MKNKLFLLATAAVFLSPVAAKVNQKSSVFVGAAGTFEMLASQAGAAAVSDYFKGENFGAVGLESGFGYKAWNNLQLAAWLKALYSFEHKFDAGKNKPNAPYAIIIEPRVTLGWEFPVSNAVTITPFLGAGLELNFAKKDGKTFATDWKVPGVLGARFGFGSIYVSANARYDLTSQVVAEATSTLGRASADTVKFWGADLSVGFEF